MPKEAEVASNICGNVISFPNNVHLLQMILFLSISERTSVIKYTQVCILRALWAALQEVRSEPETYGQATSHKTCAKQGWDEATGGLGAGTGTNGTMLGSAVLPRPSPKPVSIAPLADQGENQERNQRENILRFSHQPTG